MQDFRDTGCPRAKLRIHNSPENLYFQARFLACRAVETPYCFIQVRPLLPARLSLAESSHLRIPDAHSH